MPPKSVILYPHRGVPPVHAQWWAVPTPARSAYRGLTPLDASYVLPLVYTILSL